MMKSYYLYINEEQQGPFNIEELKNKKINRDTKVWFEGLEDWKNAEDIDELKTIVASIPPPIKIISTPPPFNKNNLQSSKNKILGLNRKAFLIVLGLIVVVFVITITAIQDFRKDKIEKGNKETEIYNEQLEIQNEEIAKQKEIISEQERLEKERIEKEKQIKIDKRVEEISNELNVCYSELDKAKKNLVDVKSFKFLRSAKARENDINIANEQISIWKNNIENLEKEMREINPNWGK